ncbi:acyltransferase family protein [Streptomyces erythrochromogenes]|uniref:acyltransferase family protein n=1 Tax=Streptomyces erythrochromogenes TaxID=285574 RepID=UPI0036913AF7
MPIDLGDEHHVDNRTSRWSGRWSHGTVAELLTGRNNSLGFIRLILATAVVVSHARVLGFGKTEFGHSFTQGQADLGKWSVYGFFILSGILVTRSGIRLGLGRFLWHRALRLLPGLWFCLFLTAFAAAPVLHWKLHGTLDGFWGHAWGPVEYLRSNGAIQLNQNDVSNVMSDAVAKGFAHDRSIDGALWSLYYEVLCYAGVALLALTGVLARARRAVLLIAGLLGWLVISPAVSNRFWAGAFDATYFHPVDIPVLGFTNPVLVIYLGFAFALGTVIELYRERIPVSDLLGWASLLVLVLSAHYGYLFVVGLPAFAYFLVWLAIRLPAPFRRVGARNDYSYGIYIYGFAVEQTLVILGFARWGLLPYLGLSLAVTVLLAMFSWHCVEKPAMRLKDLGVRRGEAGRPGNPEQQPRAAQDPAIDANERDKAAVHS